MQKYATSASCVSTMDAILKTFVSNFPVLLIFTIYNIFIPYYFYFQSYDEWKDKLDSLNVRGYFPSDESLDSYRESLIKMKDKVSDTLKDFKIGK